LTARSLSIRNVIKSYGALQNAVDDVSLDILPGEFISFLGPSGSGKTTTLMMIAGFQRPTSGEIKLGERAMGGIPPYRRNIGMVFQNYALFPHLSVADNIGFSLRMRGVSRTEKEKRVTRALAMVNLQGFERRFPAELSGGQQQRVALARALVFEPDLILLDEPLGALDKNLREHMQVELKRIHRELGVTMIYVTHDQTEAMTMSDRIAVFNRGRIEQVDSPTEIYFKPRTSFVASFIGDSNLLAGLGQADGRFLVEGIGPIRAAEPGAADRRNPLLLRPEMIRLAATAGNELPAMRIEARVNYGDNVLLIGKLGGRDFRVRVPGLDAKRLSGNDECHVTWNAEDVHVVPEAL
jgi:putative spermidine/putrescine transport system ATP-binding protein